MSEARQKMSRTGTETVFDFALPEVKADEAAARRREADALLDALAAGAAVHGAEPTGPTFHGNGAPPEQPGPTASAPEDEDAADAGTSQGAPESDQAVALDRLSAEIEGLIAPRPATPPVLPDETLPPIRTGAPQVEPPASHPEPASLPAPEPETPRPSAWPVVEAPTDPAAVHPPAPVPSRPQMEAPRPSGVAVHDQVYAMEEEIGQLYAEVNRLLSAQREITGHALALLREAHEILRTDPSRLMRARYNLRQVRTILERAKESRRQSARYAFKVVLYLALWLSGVAAGAVILLLYRRETASVLAVLLGTTSPSLKHAQPFLWTLLAGAGGGVLSGVADLTTHLRARQDFDRQAALRFYIQPVMGLVLGALLYPGLVFLSLLLGQDLAAGEMTRLLPVFAALCAGLWQQWVYATLYRVLSFLTLRPRRR
ncbi:MAG: hypothetical protein D6790_16955 [Caldilineae bacterium]|nr:MAG: hypothetical protein D6790_16955 [Caldilineae bacterium]